MQRPESPCETGLVRTVGGAIFALAAALFGVELLILLATKYASGDWLAYTALIMYGLGCYACVSVAHRLLRRRQPAI